MDPDRAMHLLRRETEQFADLLDPAAFAIPIEACPDWTITDLAGHLGGVHVWARAALGSRPDVEPDDSSDVPADPAELRDWYTEQAGELISALGAADPATSCWTLAPPHRPEFWLRRQLHETMIHRWDLETALGRPAVIEAEVAWDGIEEVATVMMPRQVRLGRLAGGPDAFSIRVGQLGGRCPPLIIASRTPAVPTAELASDPQAILLLLWGRRGLDHAGIRVSGDRTVVSRLLAGAVTP